VRHRSTPGADCRGNFAPNKRVARACWVAAGKAAVSGAAHPGGCCRRPCAAEPPQRAGWDRAGGWGKGGCCSLPVAPPSRPQSPRRARRERVATRPLSIPPASRADRGRPGRSLFPRGEEEESEGRGDTCTLAIRLPLGMARRGGWGSFPRSTAKRRSPSPSRARIAPEAAGPSPDRPVRRAMWGSCDEERPTSPPTSPAVGPRASVARQSPCASVPHEALRAVGSDSAPAASRPLAKVQSAHGAGLRRGSGTRGAGGAVAGGIDVVEAARAGVAAGHAAPIRPQAVAGAGGGGGLAAVLDRGRGGVAEAVAARARGATQRAVAGFARGLERAGHGRPGSGEDEDEDEEKESCHGKSCCPG